jgi:diguanylate cyclase (GGDEF)-like protein/PAS domain S-box-containing protein
MDRLIEAPELEQLLQENKRLNDRNRLLSSILENAPILISAKDLKGNILLANSHFSMLDGPKPEAYLNRNVYDLFPTEIADQLWENDKKAQHSQTPVHAEEQVFHKDGSLHAYHTTKFRLLDEQNTLVGTCAVSFDITDMKQLEKDVHCDHLTGLYNRRLLETTIETELARAARDRNHYIFALIDLDHFKAINDQYGHLAGDGVLVATAKTFHKVLHRPSDFSYRLGGDEFVAAFCAPCKETADELLEALRLEINSAIDEVIPDAASRCQVSIGAQIIPPGESTSFCQLYAEADKALYRAKKSADNKRFWYD